MKFNLKYFLSINFKLTEYFRTANNGNHDMLSIAVAVNFVLMLLLAATISIPVFYFNHLYAYLVLAIPALLSCTVLIACAVYFRNVKVLSVGISCILFLMINAGIYFSKGDVTVITVLWTSSIVIFTFLTISNTLGVVVLALQCAIILLYNKFPFLLNAFPNVKPLVYETTVYTVALPVFIIFYFLNRFKKSNVLLRNNLMQSVQVQQQLNATLADQFQVVQQTQQKLIESENQLRLIIETSKDIIFILDKNLTVKFASTAFADILKYDNSPDVPVIHGCYL